MAATLTVITGPMFSGKSEEMVRLLRRARIAKQKVLVMKPARDSRTGEEIASRILENGVFRNAASFPAEAVESKDRATDLINKSACDVLGIDEAQLFEYWLIDLITELKMDKTRTFPRVIYVAGLDTDFMGRPFGPMPDIMALANNVNKLTAVCFVCSRPATYTQRLSGSLKQIEIGNEDYQARCENCFEPPRPEVAQESA